MRFYDHKIKRFSDISTIDDLYPEYGIESQDDHNAPSLLILPTGQILIFYVVHDVNNSFFMKRSAAPEDISSWTKRQTISDKSTHIPYNYPQAKRLADGTIFLFYRRGVFYNSDEFYKVSKDDGQTWGKAKKLIDFGSDGVYAFIYAKNNQIHVAWNKSTGETPKKNVYYMVSPDGGETWQKKDGTKLNLPVKENKADIVFDSGDDPDYAWDIVADNQNNPYIVFAYKDDPYHEYRFAWWNGSSWVNSFITTSSVLYDTGEFFSGGIVIDPDNIYNIFLSKKHDRFELENWTSFDQGTTWKKSQSLTENSQVDNFRPQIVENYSDELSVVWSSGIYEGRVDSQWSGFNKVNIQSELTKDSIPTSCKILAPLKLYKLFAMFKKI